MGHLNPEFIDITWNAGGNGSHKTLEIAENIQRNLGIETCMHLTCTNMPIEQIDQALKEAKLAGIRNILALRGDPPLETDVEPTFTYAIDLIKYIKCNYGDYFCIGIAGYPEGHPESPNEDQDLLHLKAKVDAGASFIISQLFYDINQYFRWYDRCRSSGIGNAIQDKD